MSVTCKRNDLNVFMVFVGEKKLKQNYNVYNI